MYAAASPFAPPRAGHGFANLYHHTGVQTGVDAASPHRLVSMLFDGLLDVIAQAKGAIAAGNIELKGRAIGRALRIVDEGLKGALDTVAGGSLAKDLADLYSYITTRLLQANLHSDTQALDECVRLVSPIREAWLAIDPAHSAGQAA